MIIAKELLKRFGEFHAVNGVNLEIRKGQCFGLLGPNGAGKSTFISMIYGAVLRSSGDLKVLGMDPGSQSREIKKRIGVVTQENALDESLTVIENMRIYATFLGLPKSVQEKRIAELLDYMNLSHKMDAKIQSLSGGMKRRLVFVRALLGDPELLILDEPTTGLDPAVRHLLWGKVRELHQSGTTILLTTHYMHEAEVLCDDLAVMNLGRVVAQGSPQKLIHEHTPGYMGTFHLNDKVKLESVLKDKKYLDHYEDASGIFLRMKEFEDVSSLPEKYGVKPVQIRPSNLEDVFLKLTGKELSQDA